MTNLLAGGQISPKKLPISFTIPLVRPLISVRGVLSFSGILPRERRDLSLGGYAWMLNRGIWGMGKGFIRGNKSKAAINRSFVLILLPGRAGSRFTRSFDFIV